MDSTRTNKRLGLHWLNLLQSCTMMYSSSDNEPPDLKFTNVNSSVTDILQFALYVVVSLCLALFAFGAHVISIVAYSKMGIKDSPSVLFLSLSITDLTFSLLILASSTSILIGEINPLLTLLDPFSFSFYGEPAFREKVYSMSIVIIILLSVERCFCVIFPFRVKTLFTKSRSVKVISFVAFVFGALLIPDYLTQRLSWTFDPFLNSTRLLFWYSQNRTSFAVFKDVIFAAFLPITAGVVTTISAVILITKTRSSREFRNSAALGPDNVIINSVGLDKYNLINKKLTGKDTRLCKMVVLLDAIFITCNIPKCMILFISVADFRIDVPDKHENLALIITIIVYLFETINAAVNFWVYFFFCAKFRSACRQMFCKTRTMNSDSAPPCGLAKQDEL